MANRYVQLEPRYFLDENWEVSGSIRRPLISAMAARVETAGQTEEQTWIDWIQGVRIEVAEAAQTRNIGGDEEKEYLESELGMNIVVPKGTIEELRFHITMEAQNGQDSIVVIDGFPKDAIEEKAIVEGRIKLALNKAFMFIPVVGPIAADLLQIELNLWEFKIGSLKRVNIDFSGGLTCQPEWYFRGDGIKNDLRVALTIRKPRSIGAIQGQVRAAWVYNPGFRKKGKVGTDMKTVQIL